MHCGADELREARAMAREPLRGLITGLGDSQPSIAPERFAAALHLRQQDRAQLAHVHRTTVAEA